MAGNGGVSVINTATNQVITTVATSAGDSYGIAVSPSANGQHRVYVTNAATNTVRVINANTTTNTYTADASVTVGTAPRGIAVSADGSRAYVTNWNSNNVSVLNTSTATPTLVGSPITVGTNPIGVVVSPDGNRVYVANYGSASVSVLNPAAATPLVTTVAVVLSHSAGDHPRWQHCVCSQRLGRRVDDPHQDQYRLLHVDNRRSAARAAMAFSRGVSRRATGVHVGYGRPHRAGRDHYP